MTGGRGRGLEASAAVDGHDSGRHIAPEPEISKVDGNFGSDTHSFFINFIIKFYYNEHFKFFYYFFYFKFFGFYKLTFVFGTTRKGQPE